MTFDVITKKTPPDFNLNTNLRAKMKTKYKISREVFMEIGGKQGSRLTGRMFAN